ncbi:MAG: hypothetical protein ACE5IL_04295 [Myxococcota bacterium]
MPVSRSAQRTVSSLVLALVGLGGPWPLTAAAYPGGTPVYVTDVAPFCAGCHSSVSAGQLAGVPPKRAEAELAAHKHLAQIRAAKPEGPYAKLTESEREALIAGIEKIDAAASVEVLAPEQVSPDQIVEVTVRAMGGAGPAVGVALVDSDQRWQARPAPSAGWRVVDRAAVTGPDGQLQTRFMDGRNPALAPGTSYVNVYGVSADPEAGRFSTVSVTYRLRAPHEPGTYPLAAAFLYGTEKASPHGAVETVRGKLPLGGFAGASGRVRFSAVRRVRVR